MQKAAAECTERAKVAILTGAAVSPRGAATVCADHVCCLLGRKCLNEVFVC
jgi:hypothetical protein